MFQVGKKTLKAKLKVYQNALFYTYGNMIYGQYMIW